MQSLVRLGNNDGYIARPRKGNIGVKCLSQGHNDTLPSSGTKLRADNLVIANLCSYPLSCTAANWDDGVNCLYQGQNSAVWASN